MLVGLLVFTLAHAATSIEQSGHDEFGRRCALKTQPHVSAMIEDEWYVRPRDITFEPKGGAKGHSGRLGATVHAVSDGARADLELDLRDGRGTYFTLRIESATGYAHGCLLSLD